MYLQSPKGTLIPIGGKEDKNDQRRILCRVLEETGKADPCVTFITLATNHSDEVATVYQKAFEEIGIKGHSIINYSMHGEADTNENLEKIQACDVIMITGGDQLKLCSLLGGTKLLDTIVARYHEDEHFVLAGTSAGAAAMSTTMIVGGGSCDAMLKGTLQFTSGLGIIDRNIFIDTHFVQRGRLGRIVQLVATNPGIMGIGLAEDTGFVFKNGIVEAIGSGSVIIIDGSGIVYTDVMDICDKTPITVQGLGMHVLGPGKKFCVSGKELVRDAAVLNPA